jgi:phosphoribosylformylglycinamidine synthase
MTVSKQALDELALTEAEYEAIVERLGREPNHLELGLFGSLWSEHCGYKHSKPLLHLLPSDSHRLLVTPGSENAGVVDIGDGLAIVMKIESHNHPSAIEPYQGAATGVGGIVRDIFAMGARPIALMNSLRFGSLDDARNRYLFGGVVAGISGYGNCIGIPNVGGEVCFSDSYAGNPLVNAMCVGILPSDALVRATTEGSGNILMLVGSDTGRDGIHGASGLASRTFEEERELRPTVQVGNPFMEKLLIEACLEIAKTEHIIGIQDLGAAGLTSASVEAASNGDSGLEIDVSLVPRRETDMTPYEVMLSESQERMLVIVKPGHEDAVKAVFDKWDLQSTVIGRSTDDGLARITDSDGEGGKLQGAPPVSTLTDAPQYRLQGVKAQWLTELQEYDLATLSLPDRSPVDVLLRMLTSPNIASKEWVYRQYDHQVQTNTVAPPGADAAVLRVKGTQKGLAMSTDGNGRLCYLDPFVGGMIAVAEACRNVSCTGAEPIALTDCLNFGNPEKPETYYQLEQCILGMAEACRALNVPVISGNVSLYNETQGVGIYPTPIVGCLGLLEDVRKNVGTSFRKPGDIILLLGASELPSDAASLAGSEYLEVMHGLVAGKPTIDIQGEAALQRACRRLATEGIIESAHDCSDGGLAVALAESCIASRLGAKCDARTALGAKLAAPSARWDAILFGEAQSRIVVSLSPERLSALKGICAEESVSWCELGSVSDSGFTIGSAIHLPLSDLEGAWRNALDARL